jgi:hypothetical protein
VGNGADANSPQVEPVGVPAGLDCSIAIGAPVSVTGTSFVEQIEIVIGKMKPIPTENGGQIGTTLAMTIISAFVDSPGIMEDGEQLDNFDVGPGSLGKP